MVALLEASPEARLRGDKIEERLAAACDADDVGTVQKRKNMDQLVDV